MKKIERKIEMAFLELAGVVWGLAIDSWDDKRIQLFNDKAVKIRDNLIDQVNYLTEKVEGKE